MRFRDVLKRKEGVMTLMTEPQQEFLYDFAKTYGGYTIVEIGAFQGGSTILLCLAKPNAMVYSIDKFEHPHGEPSAEKLKANLARAGVKNHKLIEVDSLRAEWDEPIDLLFIDGDHTYLYVKHDLETFAVHARYVVMHDTKKSDVIRATNEFFVAPWESMTQIENIGSWRRGGY